jgi:hypothetical protein
MPTHDDHPWIRDEKVMRTVFDPPDPVAAALLHDARQANAINDARQATSVAPPTSGRSQKRP